MSEMGPGGRDAGAGAAVAVPSERGRRKVAMLLAVAAIAYAVDLVTKLSVVSGLEGDHRSVGVVGDVVRLEVTRNGGAAFSTGQSMTIVFTLIALVVIVAVARLAGRLHSTPWAVALGLLLGGPLGNLTDRVFRSPGPLTGHVVDFIAVEHFAVFNLADTAIVCGAALSALLSLRGLRVDGTVDKPETRAAAASPQA